MMIFRSVILGEKIRLHTEQYKHDDPTGVSFNLIVTRTCTCTVNKHV